MGRKTIQLYNNSRFKQLIKYTPLSKKQQTSKLSRLNQCCRVIPPFQERLASRGADVPRKPSYVVIKSSSFDHKDVHAAFFSI